MLPYGERINVVIRRRAVALTCMLLLPIAVSSDELIRFALSADAHRCCASTNGDCAQLSTPDQCCHTQEHAISQEYTTVCPDSPLQFVPNLAIGLPAQIHHFDARLFSVVADND